MTSGSTPATASRAPRSDALRNDRLVIDAARAVFAEQGPQASMESIAARAGLGVGTIYRRFDGKQALLDAIAELIAEEFEEASADALAQADAWTGLERLLRFIGEVNAEKQRYATALNERMVGTDAATRAFASIDELTRRAVESGTLAHDVSGDDVRALIVALHAVVATSPDPGPAARRFMDVHLAGLRAGR